MDFYQIYLFSHGRVSVAKRDTRHSVCYLHEAESS